MAAAGGKIYKIYKISQAAGEQENKKIYRYPPRPLRGHPSQEGRAAADGREGQGWGGPEVCYIFTTPGAYQHLLW